MKKLLFIGHSGYEYPHTRVRCYHFARELAKVGIPTEVLSFKDDLAPERSEADIYESLTDFDKFELTLKAFGRLMMEKDTIFYIQKAHFHSAAPYLLYRFGMNNYIFDYDDYDIPVSNFFNKGKWNRLFFGSNDYEEITRKMAAGALGCVASSHFLLDWLQESNQKVYHVATGVDSEIFYPPSENQKEIKILWNGLVWGDVILENVVFCLEIFKEVYKENKNINFLFVGGGKSMPDLRKKIETDFSNLPIEIREWVHPDEMSGILRECQIGLLPMIQSSEWIKGKSPTKLYEYMASGLAVIASDIGEPQFVIENGRSGFLANSKKEFIDCLNKLCDDSEFRGEIGAGARKRVEEKFALPVLKDNLLTMLKDLNLWEAS